MAIAISTSLYFLLTRSDVGRAIRATARHEGDMGNVEADASGNAKLDYVDHQISLANDAKSAIGRSVVVHAKPDDLKTQPSGDSGARIACGVIGWAKTQ